MKEKVLETNIKKHNAYVDKWLSEFHYMIERQHPKWKEGMKKPLPEKEE